MAHARPRQTPYPDLAARGPERRPADHTAAARDAATLARDVTNAERSRGSIGLNDGGDSAADLGGTGGKRTVGDSIQRVTYHYWFHIGEILAIRQLLGHRRLPEYVGDIDSRAPWRPDPPDD